MVQTVYYYLDSNPESRHNKNSMKHHTEKLVSEKHIPIDIYVEPTKLKCKQNTFVKLQPLNAKVDNNVVPNTTERKFSYRLNPLPNKPVVTLDQKKIFSKIPVLQRKPLHSSKQNKDVQCDASLSAADRRQKFHQSRLRAGDVSINDISAGVKHQATLHFDVLPWYERYMVQKVMAPPIPGANQKNILPPIKPVDMSAGTVQKINQPKKKCLLGEITHFPALCNSLCPKRRKSHASTVPHLPPILPLPAAPPPSISTSLETDGNLINQKISNIKENEECNLARSVLYKIVAV